MTPLLEFRCPACGEETLIRREPIYEGFKKVGERQLCASCGHELEEDVPAERPAPDPLDIFKDELDEVKVDIFSSEERQRCCRYCQHYIVNPFTQRCGLHERDVEATDLCDNFARIPPDTEAASTDHPPL